MIGIVITSADLLMSGVGVGSCATFPASALSLLWCTVSVKECETLKYCICFFDLTSTFDKWGLPSGQLESEVWIHALPSLCHLYSLALWSSSALELQESCLRNPWLSWAGHFKNAAELNDRSLSSLGKLHYLSVAPISNMITELTRKIFKLWGASKHSVIITSFQKS